MAVFTYPFTVTDGCHRPFVPIKVINPVNGRFALYRCLIDSGADKCMFPDAVVKQMMSVACGPKTKSKGIGGIPIESVPHQFMIELMSQDYKEIAWKSEIMKIDCVLHSQIPPLLGSSDFLYNFDIALNYKNGGVIVIDI
ncbi:MAG: hypothetical protein AAF600_21650 [Bacteroidota bacterium]